MECKMPIINRRHIAALLLLTTGVMAEAANPTIVVKGDGEIEVMPDIASVRVKLQSRDKDPAKAQAKNVSAIKRLFEAMQSIGVKPADLGASSYTFKRDARADSNGKILELGYYAENEVQVRAEKFEGLPAIIAVAVANGATSVDDVSYSLKDTKPSIDKAREKAFMDAKDEAEKSAKAAGLTLGPIKTISLGGAFIPEVSSSKSDYGEADLPSQLQPLLSPGTIKVSYSVTIEYELK
jgi:uncharacterized protein